MVISHPNPYFKYDFRPIQQKETNESSISELGCTYAETLEFSLR